MSISEGSARGEGERQEAVSLFAGSLPTTIWVRQAVGGHRESDPRKAQSA